VKYTGERAIPWERATGPLVMIPHIMRYAWATQHAWNKTVVDLCCGSGYGTFLLSWVAQHVTGIDIDALAIEYADLRFESNNLAFSVGDVTDPEQRFTADLYVAFECLEHLDDPAALVDSLDSPIAWSIPVNVSSRFHKHVYSVDGIRQLMAGSDFWYQSREGEIAHHHADFEPAYVLGLQP
jgi:SAM-dependent methyltransferase